MAKLAVAVLALAASLTAPLPAAVASPHVALSSNVRLTAFHAHRQRAKAKSGAPTGTSSALSGNPFEGGCDGSLSGWNTAGAGEVLPTVVSSPARTGSGSCRVVLTGSQNRSELIFGGNGGGSTSGEMQFTEGAEYWYGFSFYIQQMTWGHPGAHNLIMQFKSEGEGSPAFGLDLWDYAGDNGTSGG
ncbi:MAG TPA: heparin lyase I family protein, partial [Solirubrobacterales bacterium]